MAIPIITGRILGDHLSDPGRRGMAWVALILSLPMLLFAVVAGIGTFVLWLLLRNYTF